MRASRLLDSHWAVSVNWMQMCTPGMATNYQNKCSTHWVLWEAGEKPALARLCGENQLFHYHHFFYFRNGFQAVSVPVIAVSTVKYVDIIISRQAFLLHYFIS